MPVRDSDCAEFAVGVNICGNRGHRGTAPMPVVELLGRLTHIAFGVRGGGIIVIWGPEGVPARRRRRRAAKGGARRCRRHRLHAVDDAGGGQAT